MKKKGLIISTVVMVVVLIASLTTATYAWFTSQAQATVDDLTITTEAAQGLQIAMTGKEGSISNGLYSGALRYENNAWSGDSDTWGTYLGFGEITVGKLEHAATYFANGTAVKTFVGYTKATGTFNANEDYFTASPKTVTEGASVDGFYKLDTATNVYKEATGKAVAGDLDGYVSITSVEAPTSAGFANYLVVKTENTNSTGAYYQPIGYNSKTEPLGYKLVSANQTGTYYHLTMAVTNLMDVGALGFSIEVVPSGLTNLSGTKEASATNPGMAAATRIKVRTAQRNGETAPTFKETEIAPFSKYKLTASNTMSKEDGNGYTEAKDGKANENGKYTCVLSDGNVVANNVYYVSMYIWVEGTDAECKNVTTGTAMTVKINFAYAPKDTTSITWDFTDGAPITFA